MKSKFYLTGAELTLLNSTQVGVSVKIQTLDLYELVLQIREKENNFFLTIANGCVY
jgi:hypothetical protein